MKMRNFVIIFHVSMIGVFLFMLCRLKSIEYEAVDMATINREYKSVEEELSASPCDETSIFEIEDRYHCSIILLQDQNYLTMLYQAYENSDTVFDYLVDGKLSGKIIFPRTDEKLTDTKRELQNIILMLLIVVILLTDSLLIFLYVRIYRPFSRLQRFAMNISSGNLDIPLEMNHYNYFGAFTESFDIMRDELKAAREGEARANKSKKELVASLSHDIKTPVSTIKALCEILEIKLADREEVSKVHTIELKANLIDQLISNMFHATLSELEALKISPTQEVSTIILSMINDMNHYGKIKIENEIPSCLIICDRLRLTQVFDNIINNSYKYADTTIWIKFWESEQRLFVKIRDEGQAIDDLDFALICEKYYRGKNAEGKTGAGLGLYLSKMFMEGMQGSMSCEEDHGFSVVLSLMKEGKDKHIEVIEHVAR